MMNEFVATNQWGFAGMGNCEERLTVATSALGELIVKEGSV